MVQGRFYGSAFKTKTMVTIETLSDGMAYLSKRIREMDHNDRQSISLWMEFYRAQTEIEKLRMLRDIRIEIERVGDMLENKK
jgi:hypothetical protein